MKKLRIIVRKSLMRAQKEIRLFTQKSKYDAKIFCVGYNKTGTTSLGRSLKMLGYNHSSFNKRVWGYYSKNQFDRVLKYTSKFESFDDLPWLKEDMIPLLDATFPGSKFIYLKRDEEAWKKSYYHWRFRIFGIYPDVDEAWAGYKKHEDFVLNYFQGRPDDEFIIIDIEDENGFQRLAKFLGVETERKKFPHMNKRFFDESTQRNSN